ncbi:hypothetical protein B14911_02979 [Bacillus sp. NRRL B-14911]|nr:hypothetical protein B14911_02979 [Bacillus sp. NRRL B-14911]
MQQKEWFFQQDRAPFLFMSLSLLPEGIDYHKMNSGSAFINLVTHPNLSKTYKKAG